MSSFLFINSNIVKWAFCKSNYRLKENAKSMLEYLISQMYSLINSMQSRASNCEILLVESFKN